jgi:predicted Zn-dependent peptidase
VVTIAGRVTEKQAMDLSERFFAPIQGKKDRAFLPLKTYGTDRVFIRSKSTEQAHLVLGVPGVHSQDKDHFAHRLLAIILGGNMSSRMFLNIREARGLCYYISTDVDSYMDAGSLSTRAGVDQSRLDEAIKAIVHEYMMCSEKGVTDEELKRAKDFLKGKISLSMEDSEERAHFYGKQQLLYPKVRDLPEYFAEIDKVTTDQVNKLASRLLKPEEFRLVVIGKEKDKEKLTTLLKP